MIRVYLDKQIYTYLRNDPKYSGIKDKLLQSKSYLQFFCSQAHIEDLKKDLTNEKFDDIKFMHNFAEPNYLLFNFFKKCCDFSAANPIEELKVSVKPTQDNPYELNSNLINSLVAFKDIPEFQQYSVLFDSVEKLWEINSQNTKENIRPSFPDNPTPEQIEFMKEIGYENREYTWNEWEEATKDWSNRIQKDDKMYRRVRQLSKNSLGVDINRESVPIEKKNEMLKDTPIGKTFLESLDTILTLLSQIPFFDNDYMKVNLAYTLLNGFGLDSEKSRKVRFSSTQNDALHVYYATHMDYLVSCDEGMIEKATFIYNLFGIKTKVVHLDDFVKELTILDGDFSDAITFVKSLNYELSHGLMFDCYTDIESGNSHRRIKLTKRFFSYFDELEIHTLADKDLVFRHVFVLYRCKKVALDFVTFKEIQTITNKIYAILGNDDEFRQEFSDVDQNEVRNNTWSGRKWNLGDAILKLEFNYSHNLLTLMYLITD